MTTKPPYPVDIGSIWQHSNGAYCKVIENRYKEQDADYFTYQDLRCPWVTFQIHKSAWYRTMTFEAIDYWSFDK